MYVERTEDNNNNNNNNKEAERFDFRLLFIIDIAYMYVYT